MSSPMSLPLQPCLHLLLPASLALLLGLAAGCGDKEVDTPSTDKGDEDPRDTGTPSTDDTAPPEDTGPPPALLLGGELTGSVVAVIGGNFVLYDTVSVSFLPADGSEETAPVATNPWGMFRLEGAPQGKGSICVTADGLEAPVCTETLTLGAEPLHVGTIEVPLAEPVAWGRVGFPDGTPCAYSFPAFGVWVHATVTTEDGRAVQTNASGEYILPGYQGALTASCEKNTTTGEASGTAKATDLILTSYLRERGPIQLTGRANASVHRPPEGSAIVATLHAEVEEGATLSVRWRGPGLEASGTKVAWTVPSGGSSDRLWALIGDGMGGYALTSSWVMPGEPRVYAGQLLDEDGAPIVGAVVRVNGEEVTTDEEGLYDLEVTKHADRYLLSVEHPDFTPCLQIEHDGWRGSVPEALDPEATVPCLRRLDTTTFTASRGTTLKAGDLSIPIAGGVMVDENGKAVAGDVEAAWYAVPPGEPLAAEPILVTKEDVPTYAESLGGLYLIFRSPTDPTQRYFVAKGSTVTHTLPATVKDSDTITLAALDAETGRLETAASPTVSHGSGSWSYSLPLDTDFFVPMHPIADTGCVRINVPRARFAGALHITASVPGTQSAQPQYINRPVNSDLVVIGGLPRNQATTLYLFHLHPTLGQQLVESLSVTPSGKVTAFSAIDLYPFQLEEVCADVTLPSQAPQGQFLTRHQATDVLHGKTRLMTAADVGELYYNAIDPLGEKTTLSGWLDSLDWSKAHPRDLTGDEAMAIYGNAADLGFGREMHLQILSDPDGNSSTTEPPVVAMYTVNYENVHHAAIGNAVAATVAMEFSPHPLTGGAYYTKFFVFDASGDRIPTIALDDGGPKAVPDLCANCHGGYPADESAFYTIDPAQNVVAFMHPYPNEGRLGDAAHFIPFAVESFAYSPAFPRAAQEEEFRILNEALLLTNVSQDARAMLHGWYDSELNYASDTLGTSGTSQDTAWYPTNPKGMGGIGGDWTGHEDLYQSVYQPYCRSCHMSFDGANFANSAMFLAYSGTIRSYVCDEPTMMPQAQVTQQNLFRDGAALQELLDAMSAHDPSGWSAVSACPN